VIAARTIASARTGFSSSAAVTSPWTADGSGTVAAGRASVGARQVGDHLGHQSPVPRLVEGSC
jgi:hypothetical protein